MEVNKGVYRQQFQELAAFGADNPSVDSRCKLDNGNLRSRIGGFAR